MAFFIVLFLILFVFLISDAALNPQRRSQGSPPGGASQVVVRGAVMN